jgi:thioredoxin-related protein
LTRSLGVRAYPTIVFLDKSSNLIHRLRGYKSPKQIEVYLKLFTDENFKQIQTQEDFQKFYDSFEYEFGSK